MKLKFTFHIRTLDDSRLNECIQTSIGSCRVTLHFEKKEFLQKEEIVFPCDIFIQNVQPQLKVRGKEKWLVPQADKESFGQAWRIAFLISNIFKLYVGRGEIIRQEQTERNPEYVPETPKDHEICRQHKIQVVCALELAYRVEGVNRLLRAGHLELEAVFRRFWDSPKKQELLALYADAMRLGDPRARFRELHLVLERADEFLRELKRVQHGKKRSEPWKELSEWFTKHKYPKWAEKLEDWETLRNRCSHSRRPDYISPGDYKAMNEVREALDELQAAAKFVVEKFNKRGGTRNKARMRA